ncbi:MAG: HD-GYP domain-containing protein [Actinobacteria bacterium]|nr:HD-GYP domain-containing protein [Actinomycetota bacterium]
MDRSESTSVPVRSALPAVPRVLKESGWKIYAGFVIFAGVVFTVALVYLQVAWLELPRLSILAPNYSVLGLLFFVGVGVFASRSRIHIGANTDVSAAFLADFLSAALFGPLMGGLVAAAGILSEHEKGRPWSRTAFTLAAVVLITGVAGMVFWWLHLSWGGGGLALAAAGVIAGAAYQLLNFVLLVPIAWLRGGVGPGAFFHEGFRPFLPFHAFFLALSLGLLFSFQDKGVLGFGLAFLPVLGLIYAFRTFARQREQARSLERFSFQIAASMITALDLKDNYTAQHSAAVAQYSFDTAQELGLLPKQCNLAHLAGLLHDLGKISVPDGILNSRECLDHEEWDVVRGHATAGQKIVSNMTEFEELGRVILHHHERYDGTGYPKGLSGEEIPLLSRIVAVADSYSAMVSARPYRSMRDSADAMEELRRGRGGQFDPVVAGAFLDVLARSSIEYRTADQVDFQVQFQKVRFLADIA